MSYAFQVGYVVNEGAVFVIPSGTENKYMILLCRFENGRWVTKTREPAYVAVLNDSGGDQFPYATSQCTIEGYDNDQYVDLVGTDIYKLPNFGAHSYAGSYQNVASDWLSVSFRAPNLIRNLTEWNTHGGNPGTPAAQTTSTGSGNTPTGTGAGTTLYKAPTGTGTGGTLTYQQVEVIGLVGLAVIGLIVFAVTSNNNSRRR